MIDFQNSKFIKLGKSNFNVFAKNVDPLLVNGESVVATYISIRDGVVFTNRRIIAINVQGISGKKKDITSLPYNKIQAFSVETAGIMDLDGELEIWFSGLGKVRFEFSNCTDISEICRLISSYVLDI
ncbi:MAG: PH domain-containing protein [Acutalibacteraceae bacterium]